jgi:restriction system protein
MEGLLLLIPILISGAIGWAILARDRRLDKRKEEEGKRELERLKVFREAKQREVLGSARAIIDTHAPTLYRKKLQKVRHDDYGNKFDSEWVSEKNHFYKAVTVPQLLKKYNSGEIAFYSVDQDSTLIEVVVEEYAQRFAIEKVDVDQLTPTEFEAHCASLLIKGGWSARTTQASGDQGIDIIGERNGLKAVFQVKKSSSTVGNKAVQEIIAGRSFALADLAFVVSNADFTTSAKELAGISGVRLLHYSELTTLSPA